MSDGLAHSASLSRNACNPLRLLSHVDEVTLNRAQVLLLVPWRSGAARWGEPMMAEHARTASAMLPASFALLAHTSLHPAQHMRTSMMGAFALPCVCRARCCVELRSGRSGRVRALCAGPGGWGVRVHARVWGDWGGLRPPKTPRKVRWTWPRAGASVLAKAAPIWRSRELRESGKSWLTAEESWLLHKWARRNNVR